MANENARSQSISDKSGCRVTNKARDRIDGMISFTSFPVQPERGSEYARYFPDDEDHMDLDDGDFEAGGSKITWPGETITSSQAFMRYE
jgi:hypothetical protein